MSIANEVSGPDLGDVSRVGGVSLLVGSKAADVAISLPVLQTTPAAELNPLAKAAFSSAGTPGFVGLALLVVAVIVGVVETGAGVLDLLEAPDWSPAALRAGAYGVVSLVWLAVSAHNVVLVAGAL